MVLTITKQIGDKTFIIRKKIPLDVLNDALPKFKKIAAITEEGEQERQSLALAKEVMRKMVLNIQFILDGAPQEYGGKSEEYWNEWADEDDFILQQEILEDLGKNLAEKMNDLKKKRMK